VAADPQLNSRQSAAPSISEPTTEQTDTNYGRVTGPTQVPCWSMTSTTAIPAVIPINSQPLVILSISQPMTEQTDTNYGRVTGPTQVP